MNRSSPAVLRTHLRALRAEMAELFAVYDVPEAPAHHLLRDTLGLAAVECPRIREPRTWLLATLESRCRAWAEARDAEEEGEDDERPPAP